MIVSFVILQLIEILAPSLRLPEWTMNFILVLLIVGFIIAVILSWIYDVHPEEGIVKTESAHQASEAPTAPSSKGWRIASYISFVVIVTLIVLNIIPRSGKKELLDKSIAVLPFTNDSEDKENEYFINGIMEEILIDLQSISDLRVPGRTSVEQYRNPTKSIPQIGQELGVSYIVGGSAQKYGNTFILRVVLSDAAKDKQLWAESYNEKINNPEDIVRLQSKIAETISVEIEARITPEEKLRIEKSPTASITAYEIYQKGNEEHWKFVNDNNLDALPSVKGFSNGSRRMICCSQSPTLFI